MELTGQFMALFANAHRNEKEKPTPFTREDFFKLSYDKPDEEGETLSPEEQFKKIKGQLGGRIKHGEQ